MMQETETRTAYLILSRSDLKRLLSIEQKDAENGWNKGDSNTITVCLELEPESASVDIEGRMQAEIQWPETEDAN
jgi:hypothetical protein